MKSIAIPQKGRSLEPNERMIMKLLSDGKSLKEIAKIMKLPARVCKSADMAKGTEDISVEACCCRIREKGYQLPKPGDHYEP